jgi:hypothetical protein
MIVGAAQVDVTPAKTVELSGFAARQQPMTGVLDPIFAKALYLADGNERLLWIHVDALALGAEFVSTFREWVLREHGLKRVLLSATHTHAAPAVVPLTGCGRCDPDYLRSLQSNTQRAASEAIATAQAADLVFAQTDFVLAIDRRNKPSAHVDSRLSFLGWERADNSFLATVLNYPMHPVSLGHVNRQVSADWCGAAASQISEHLAGHPITLLTNGACGNLNPPARPVSAKEVVELGRTVGRASCSTGFQPVPSSLRVSSIHVAMSLDVMSPKEIDRLATARLNEFENTAWAGPFREAITTWAQTQKHLIASDKGSVIDIELFAVDLGPVVILAISGELFSRFTAMLRERVRKPLFVVGYANAVFGYIPTREAYEEGGYEVDQAHFFYNSFRPKIGGLELLADRAVELIKSL